MRITHRRTHRRCLPLGCALFLLVTGNARADAATAADLPPAAKPTISLDHSTAQHYEVATRNLRAGRWFERAAEQLREAVRQEPYNYRYHLALGCAYASRAAALAYAAEFARRLADDQRTYPERLAEWQKAQQKPDNPLAAWPRPEPPAPFALRTRDDNRPFSMTPDQVQAAFDARSKEAAAAWDTAVSLTKTDQERAEAQYVRGWGLILLEMYRSNPAFATVRVPEEARKSLEAATRLNPEKALYWQGLGDVHMGVAAAQPTAARRGEAKAAYEKSLALQARNAPLWYRLYQMEAGTPWQSLSAEGRENAQGYLRKAAQYDPQNAAYWYLLAALRLRGTPYGRILGSGRDQQEAVLEQTVAALKKQEREAARTAISDLERGNAASRYAPARYDPAIPSLLSAAWEYMGRFVTMDVSEGAHVRELARAASGSARVAAQENDMVLAVRASRAVIGLGHRMMRAMPVRDTKMARNAVINAMVGAAVASIGYDTLIHLYEGSGDDAGKRQAEAEYASVRERQSVWLREVQRNAQSGASAADY